jgi:sodium/proline symporter
MGTDIRMWSVIGFFSAFIVASIMIVVVSLCTKAPSEEIVKEFEEVKAMRD